MSEQKLSRAEEEAEKYANSIYGTGGDEDEAAEWGACIHAVKHGWNRALEVLRGRLLVPEEEDLIGDCDDAYEVDLVEAYDLAINIALKLIDELTTDGKEGKSAKD